MMFNLFLERFIIIINVIFIGNYGSINEIAAVGLGNLIIAIFS